MSRVSGMFPYVCLATMPLFCHTNWPRKLLTSLTRFKTPLEPTNTNVCIYSQKIEAEQNKDESGIKGSQKFTCALLLTHVALQGFLPYSHFLTQGYNNWTNGLYGYSWDMMVHSWETILIVVRVVNKDTGEEHFLDPQAWTHTERYSKHGDMMHQYAHCLRDNIQRDHPTIRNLAVHMDVWCSLNRRFQQRMFDPRADLLSVSWSPFRPISWLMPLLTEFNPWRQRITQLEEQVYSWSNHTDVLFVADFPDISKVYFERFHTGPEKRDRGVVWYGVGEAVKRGEGLTAAAPQSLPLSLVSELDLRAAASITEARRVLNKVRTAQLAIQTEEALPPLLEMTSRPLLIARPGPVWNLSISLHLENYIHEDLTNVSLTVLEGEVVVEYENRPNKTVSPGESTLIPTKMFHKVHTVSPSPSCYMYVYTNQTLLNSDTQAEPDKAGTQKSFAFLQETRRRWINFLQSFNLIGNALLKIMYSVPMNIRVRQY
ncbi:hypothetical protein J6590_049981 [Homalodisca vitripennis]|nr:hypothetical protein J6590_049981 [Homalodisca vitripennis]